MAPTTAEPGMSRPTLMLLPGMLNTGILFDRLVPLLGDAATLIVADGFVEPSMAAMAARAETIKEARKAPADPAPEPMVEVVGPPADPAN